jgi:Putative transposase
MKSFHQGKLKFHGEMAGLAKPADFEALCRRASRIEWVVYAKAPFGGPEQVLKYLARYTHRVAISNRRLLSMEHGHVTFEWKDYAGGNKARTMTLDAVEFIRRFLLHILPGRFVRIRQFGFLANRVRGEKLALCRALLAAEPAPTSAASSNGDAKIEDHDRTLCPICRTGHLIRIETILPAACLPLFPRQDSS